MSKGIPRLYILLKLMISKAGQFSRKQYDPGFIYLFIYLFIYFNFLNVKLTDVEGREGALYRGSSVVAR